MIDQSRDAASPPPPITARQVLQALSEVRRRKVWPVIQELEKTEPDLTEFLLEELSAIHQTLMATGAPPKVVRRLQRQVQVMAVVLIVSLRD